MNKNVEELRTILKEYNLNEPAYKGLIDIEVLKGVLDEVDRLNNIIGEAIDNAIHIQKTFGYVLDDLIYLLMQGSDKE